MFFQEPELEPSQQHGEEMPEDMLERLAHMEMLVVQLKDLVQEKDVQLQQKDSLLQVPLMWIRVLLPSWPDASLLGKDQALQNWELSRRLLSLPKDLILAPLGLTPSQ